MSSPSAVHRPDSAPPAAGARSPRAWRWIAVLAVVIGAHGLAALWFQRHHQSYQPVDTKQVPVQVALLKPERIEQQPAATGPHPPAPAQAAVHRAPAKPAAPGEHVLTSTRPEPKPAVAAATSDAASAAAASASSATAAANAAAAASAVANAASAASNASATAAGNHAKTAAPGVKFQVPPSGDLDYDTFYNGVRNQPGTIHWSSDGQHYEMVVSVPLPFVGTFSWTSHGKVDAFGLAPDQYIEQRGHRAADVTIFNRETKQIGFTRTPSTLPLTDGAQDRFSMIMQLASLVRGDPDAYKPGVTRQFFVVDNDSGENWPIETIGDETVRTAQGFVNARHFMRLPRHDGDRRRIDVWLAPSLGWLPARLVQTEPNGTEVELLWRGKLEAPQAHPAPSAASPASSAADDHNPTGAPANSAPMSAPTAPSAPNSTPAPNEAAPSSNDTSTGTEAAPPPAPAAPDASPDDGH